MKKLFIILLVSIFASCSNTQTSVEADKKIDNLEKRVSKLENLSNPKNIVEKVLSDTSYPDGVIPVKVLSYTEKDEFLDMANEHSYTWVNVKTEKGEVVRVCYPTKLPIDDLKTAQFCITKSHETTSYDHPILVKINSIK